MQVQVQVSHLKQGVPGLLRVHHGGEEVPGGGAEVGEGVHVRMKVQVQVQSCAGAGAVAHLRVVRSQEARCTMEGREEVKPSSFWRRNTSKEWREGVDRASACATLRQMCREKHGRSPVEMGP